MPSDIFEQELIKTLEKTATSLNRVADLLEKIIEKLDKMEKRQRGF
jgi:hypothetical protein